MDHSLHAGELFMQGYSCSQAVAAAFSDVTGISPELSARMVSAFGGGLSRLREVCGAVSGMAFVLGILYGYDRPEDEQGKKELYRLTQQLAGEFREANGSIICREILKNPPSDPNPTSRTAEFYKIRPCARLVVSAAEILDRYIAEHPPVQTA